MLLRDGFRLAGIRAEIEYLRGERHSGEAIYWPDAGEIRRRITQVDVAPNGNAIGKDADMDREHVDTILRGWLERCETTMRIIFKRGAVNRIER